MLVEQGLPRSRRRGRASSRQPDFLDARRSSRRCVRHVALVSAGYRNRWGFPRDRSRRALARSRCAHASTTSDSGAIEITFAAGRAPHRARVSPRPATLLAPLSRPRCRAAATMPRTKAASIRATTRRLAPRHVRNRESRRHHDGADHPRLDRRRRHLPGTSVDAAVASACCRRSSPRRCGAGSSSGRSRTSTSRRSSRTRRSARSSRPASPIGIATAPIIKESIEDTGRHVVHELDRFIGTLGTIASLSPLMGLLGTVLGMIRTFNAITTARHRQSGSARRRHRRGADHDRGGPHRRDSGADRLPATCAAASSGWSCRWRRKPSSWSQAIEAASRARQRQPDEQPHA